MLKTCKLISVQTVWHGEGKGKITNVGSVSYLKDGVQSMLLVQLLLFLLFASCSVTLGICYVK